MALEVEIMKLKEIFKKGKKYFNSLATIDHFTDSQLSSDSMLVCQKLLSSRKKKKRKMTLICLQMMILTPTNKFNKMIRDK